MILVGIPYHPAKRYALQHLYDWIDNQTYKDVDIVMRADTGGYGRPNAVKTQFEFFRRLVLSNDNYTHLYILEADTIPPLDVLTKLKRHKHDIVGALYRYRSEDAPIVAWPKENIVEGLCEVDGMGTGAVLLSRKALSEFTFFDWPQPDADYPMYDALRAKGYTVYLDCDTVCKHYINDKDYR